MRHELHSEIEIDASPEEVWSVLTDLARLRQLEPVHHPATGAMAVGQRMAARAARRTGGPPSAHRDRIRRVLAWLGRIGPPGLFDARHRFELTPVVGGTRFVQHESFSGLLVGSMRRSLDGATRAGFEAMNVALKQRVLHGARV